MATFAAGTTAGTRKRSMEEKAPRRLRSKIPRRPRIPLFPISCNAYAAIAGEDEADSAASCFRSNVTAPGDYGISSEFLRPVRWYPPRQKLGEEVEISSCSDIESKQSEVISGASRCFCARNFDDKKATSTEVPVSFTTTSTGAVAELSAPSNSEISCLESISKPAISEISTAPVNDVGDDFDLKCSEEFSSADGSPSYYSTCNEDDAVNSLSELIARSSGDLYYDSSDNYSFFDSGEEFTGGSCDGSAPLSYLPVFLHLTRQFIAKSDTSFADDDDEFSEDFTPMRFKDEEDEESYHMLRTRERRDSVLHNYPKDCSDLVLDQRLLMVNWILEHSKATKLHCETLFLGVALLDRVLTRGHFKSERDLKLLGIACITIATRIEEKQPYNTIRQKTFMVGRKDYKRSEVVAMEWLVMEILDFQCSLPTVHNFLWFYLKVAKADTEVEKLANSLAVLSLVDNSCLSFWPSTIAAGIVILASLAAGRDHSCHMVMETHVRTKRDDLPECIESLEWLVKYV